MSETITTQEINGTNETFETANASAAIGVSSAVIQEVQEFLNGGTRTLEVEIFNQTEYILTHHDMYSVHGTFGSVAELPSIAPLATDNEGNQYEFAQSMGMMDNTKHRGSAGVMVWEIVDAEMYLIVCGYVRGLSLTTTGYFELSETEIDAEDWWNANSDNLVNQGSIGHDCNTTVGGISISGTMNDVGNCQMPITLAPAS